MHNAFEPPRGSSAPGSPPLRAHITEVGPRDGLQSIARTMATADKIRWIQALYDAGLREIEVASFVPAHLLPQMADAAAVVAFATTLPGLCVAALVPNLRGAQAALAAGVHKLSVPCSASLAHSLANVRKTTDAMVMEVRSIHALRRELAPHVRLEAGISVAFGCTLQGRVPQDDVIALMEALLEAGADESGLADTTGMANPAQVRRLYARAFAEFGAQRVGAAHMHNTRGQAVANCLAAFEAGVRSFAASLAGLGGCPHAPGASGNVVTEDLAWTLEAMGIDTGLDLDALLAAREPLSRGLPGEPLFGMLAGAGLPLGFVYANGRTASAPSATPSAKPVATPEAGSAASPAATPAGTDAAATAKAPTQPAGRKLPYAGLRMVEFTHMVMGPTCGMLFADLGAEVIKVEPLKGDNTRHLLGSGAGFYPLFNRNKKSLTLDLKTPEGREAAHRLIATADIVSHNFRPETMAAQGLDYATLKALNPQLIYIALKGFLPGPYAHRTALDEVVQMMGGLAYMTGPAGQPLRAGSSVNDIMGGLFGAIAAMAALTQRESTGQGQEVQAALFENNVFLVAQHMLQFAVTGVPADPMPSRISAWGVYDVFTVAGGEQIFLCAVTDKQWAVFCSVLGLADLAGDARFATNNDRVRERASLIPILRERFAQRDASALAQLFETHGLPYAPIKRPQDLMDDPHLLATGTLAPMQLESGETANTVLFPFTLDGQRLGLRLNPPRLGEHSAAILASLGYNAAQIARLSPQIG